MNLTAAELAEQLRSEANDGYTTTAGKWLGVAHKAAELLGVELTPERLEPGLYNYGEGKHGLVDADGKFWILYNGHLEERDLGAYAPVKVEEGEGL